VRRAPHTTLLQPCESFGERADTFSARVANSEALKGDLAAELAAEPWASFRELTGDVRLLRFLRGHELGVGAAAAAFRRHLAWRQEHRVDDIRQAVVGEPGAVQPPVDLEPSSSHELCGTSHLTEALAACTGGSMGLEWGLYPRGDEIQKHFPHILYGGQSRDGHLLQVDYMSMVNTDGLIGDGEGCIGTADFTHSFIYMLEARNKLMDDMSRSSGRMVRVVQIRDLTGWWPSRRDIGFGKLMVALSQDNYPETMDKIVFLHAGSVFSMVMAGQPSPAASVLCVPCRSLTLPACRSVYVTW
jgi:hypothetical protein